MKTHSDNARLAVDLEMSAEEHERSRMLSALIQEQIASSDHQAIPFSSYMNLALYAPNCGYYTSAGRVVGAGGDFITAPELGEVFGIVLASKIADCRTQFENPPVLYEFGAGNGTLAMQILEQLHRRNVDIENYVIVEVSPVLREIQKDTFSRAGHQVGHKIEWRETLPQSGFDGIVIANEVIDAMPVELFFKAGDECRQGFVVETDGGLGLEYRTPVRPDFRKSINALNLLEFDDEYFSEIHCQAEAWIRTLAQMMRSGSILIADYGFPEHEYYHHDRNQGTLVCHRRHRLVYDPFAYIGCQDITAHVNYTGLARAAAEMGMEVNGFTNLGSFVVDIAVIGAALEQATQNSAQHARELDKLSSPQEMGEIFKVMELTKNFNSTGLGFELSDRTHRLGVSDPNFGAGN
ncbi:MAG: SAM-dependent methyltransferase [Acidiferrobacterales bacterium]|nr:SAM-dependent methyltransferase [Acidiferrobacterales bacterium]